MTRAEVQTKIFSITTEFPNASSAEVYTKLSQWLNGQDLESENLSQEFMESQILNDFNSYDLVANDGIIEEEKI